MKKVFGRPYIIDSSFFAQARKALVSGLFVFLFLLIFQPFQLNTYPKSLLILTGGYGAVCAITMVGLNFVVPLMFTNYFVEERWTVGKHIFWTCVNVAIIGLANALYSQFMEVVRFNLRGILLLEIFTFSLAVFPVAAGVLWNENRLSKKFQQDSERANKTIADKKAKEQTPEKQNKNEEKLNILSDNAGENFTIHPKNLRFVKAAENYAEVVYLENDTQKKKVIRASLKRLEESWADFEQLYRCHKSYIVNLQQVRSLSGNAQGLKLHLLDVSEPIPVSRQLNKSIKEKLETFA